MSNLSRAALAGQGLAALLIALSPATLRAEALPMQPEPWRSKFGQEGTVKVRVQRSQIDRLMSTSGRALVAEYESTAVLEVPVTDAFAIEGAEVLTDENLIFLNTGALDTSSKPVREMQGIRTPMPGRALHLVQFAAPVQPGWMDQLAATGVEVVTYLPSNAYLVYGDAAQLAQLQLWAATDPHVQWDAPYDGVFKIDPAAVAQMAADAAPREGDAARAAPTTRLYAIQTVKDAEANKASDALIDALRSGAVFNGWDALNYHNTIAPIPSSQLELIAAMPDVVSIQAYDIPVLFDERQDMIVSGNISGTNPSGPGYLAWLASKGFTQAQFNTSNFVVDISDSGVDNGTTSPNHFGLYQSGIRPGTSRIAYNRLMGTANSGSTLQGCDGHGNLNTHIIAGYVDVAGSPHADASGYHYGLGVCPFVKVGSSVIFDPSTFTSPNYTTLQSTAYNSGARISSNSWGNTSGNTYNVDSQTYDSLVRDAQPTGAAFPAAGNQEMIIVFAAGNSGSAANTVHPPATGKNLITVGAAENVQAFGGSDGCATADAEANSINDIASFSSRGPCSDTRKKPEIVAPGTHVSGGVAQTASPAATGTANACFTASGVCGGVGSNFFPAGQQFYTASSGTSHSTPAVAGACALVRQFFLNQGMGAPSPAMTKAMLMNGARYMNGTGANDTLWSNNQGMGEMNLADVFNRGAVTPTIFRDQVGTDTFTASGQTRTFVGTISDTSKPFRVTLAWTDAPGATTGTASKNNLDLTVTIGANTYRGNVFTGANSTTGGSADTLNNAESVFLPAGTSGSFTATVTGTNINSDGVPNSGGALDQDFALVVYNGSAASVAVLGGTGANTLTDTAGNGNANGRIDPGESAINVTVPVINTGNTAATGVTATLVSNSPTVTVTTANSTYANLAASGGTASNNTPYVLSVAPGHTCGDPISLTLNITSAQGTGTYPFTLPTGLVTTGSPTTVPYTGPVVAIPDNSTTGGSATLTVSGISGVISDVNLRFDGASCNATAGSTTVGLDHTYLADLTITLQSPSGTIVTLMAGAGGSGNNLCSTTLDDEAASSIQSITAAGNPWSGSYTPSSPLSALDGQNPNGAWILKAVDGAAVDTGNIRAFSLIITNTSASCTPPNSGCTGASVATGPANSTVCSGAGASFSVTAGGTGPFTYQWRKNTSSISGATSSTYSIASTTTADTGSYDCVVTNSCGNATSNPATLTVNTAPATSNPSSTTVCSGLPASFTVSASGSPAPTFQWRKNTSNISGANSSTYTIPSTSTGDAGSYDCVVTNSCGSATSNPATLTVNTGPSVTNPANSTVCAGAAAAFSVSASGSPAPTFQWRKNTANISGANASTYSIPSTTTADAGSYDCVVTNSCGNATSNPATLTVNTAAVITANPTPATTCTGAPATFTVSASGSPAPAFQWRKNTVNISGATSSTYSIPSTSTGDAGSYDCVVTNSCGSDTSAAVSLTVNTPATVTADPSDAAGCPGSNVTFTASASGSPTPGFQWRRNTVDIPGATSASYTIPAIAPGDTGSYDCVVTNACGNDTSAPATLTVTTPCCDSIDYNGDGLQPDTADIDDFLSVFSGGGCSTGTCADLDFNNDGLFPDTADIDSLLSVFSGGPCL
ncbi:MAG: immunoglobulin domain-containing protein [Phycisphaerales bacterium]